jgi:hypothetical protein
MYFGVKWATSLWDVRVSEATEGTGQDQHGGAEVTENTETFLVRRFASTARAALRPPTAGIASLETVISTPRSPFLRVSVLISSRVLRYLRTSSELYLSHFPNSNPRSTSDGTMTPGATIWNGFRPGMHMKSSALLPTWPARRVAASASIKP